MEVKVGAGNIKYREPMKYQIFHKYQDSNWIPTNLYSTDLGEIIRKAQECSKDSIAYGMTAVVEANTNHHLHVVQFPSGGGGNPCYVNPGYSKQVTAAMQHKTELVKVSPKTCPDCKDGFYYPLIGSKEPCPTCSGLSNDSKLIMHLQDVWADHPWGLTKISKPIDTGCRYNVNAHSVVRPDTMPEIINDKIVDQITETMFQARATEFYEFEPPVFKILNMPDGDREISANFSIGLQ